MYRMKYVVLIKKKLPNLSKKKQISPLFDIEINFVNIKFNQVNN